MPLKVRRQIDVIGVCGIAGVISKDGSNVSPKLEMMLESIRHRGPDGCGVAVGQSIRRGSTVDDIDFGELSGPVGLGHTRLAIVGGFHGQQPLQDCDKKLTCVHNGEIYNFRELREGLARTHNFVTRSDSETIVHLVEERLSKGLSSAVEETLKLLDGMYALAIMNGKEIVITRDMMGIKQLYVGENEQFIAFASERKALWSVGITDEQRLPPGSIARASSSGLVIRKVTEPRLDREKSIKDIDEAVAMYSDTLIKAVKKRVRGLERVGIIFSGGIDSLMIAHIARRYCDVTCYTGGLVDSGDVKFAKDSAERLNLPIRVNVLSLQDIERLIPGIVEAIEDRQFGQIEVAIPIYAAVERAHEDGLKVVLTGQGADELFGGYPWYRRIVEIEGYESFDEYSKGDILNIYRETLEREDKITMRHSIELRVPFLDPEIIAISRSMDDRLKIRSPNDRLGKFVHREVAKRLGIPRDLADRPKEAAQHGSGSHDALLRIAKRNGYDEPLLSRLDYDPSKSVREQLGSSVRYGYKYGEKDMWTSPGYVQLYIDVIATENNLINQDEKKYLAPILQTINSLRT